MEDLAGLEGFDARHCMDAQTKSNKYFFSNLLDRLGPLGSDESHLSASTLRRNRAEYHETQAAYDDGKNAELE